MSHSRKGGRASRKRACSVQQVLKSRGGAPNVRFYDGGEMYQSTYQGVPRRCCTRSKPRCSTSEIEFRGSGGTKFPPPCLTSDVLIRGILIKHGPLWKESTYFSVGASGLSMSGVLADQAKVNITLTIARTFFNALTKSQRLPRTKPPPIWACVCGNSVGRETVPANSFTRPLYGVANPKSMTCARIWGSQKLSTSPEANSCFPLLKHILWF